MKNVIIHKPSFARLMPNDLQIEVILDTLVGEMKNTNRRLDEVIKNQEEQRKSINILNADRDILESIITYQRELRSILNFFKEHQKEDTKEIQLDISEVKSAIDKTLPKVEQQVIDNLDRAIDVIRQKRGIAMKDTNNVWYKKLWQFLTSPLRLLMSIFHLKT